MGHSLLSGEHRELAIITQKLRVSGAAAPPMDFLFDPWQLEFGLAGLVLRQSHAQNPLTPVMSGNWCAIPL